jgi:hypothetical protein
MQPVAPLAGAAQPIATERAPAPPPRDPIAMIEAFAVGAAGTGGAADTAGGGLGAELFLVRALGLRLGGAIRAGTAATAQATLLDIAATGGLVLHPVRAGPSRPLGFSLRVDYLLMRQSMAHLSADDPSPATQARWLSGVDAVIDVEWLFAPQVGLMLGLGAEDVFASTYVNVREVRVATIPALRGLGEAGLRTQF